MKGKTIEKLPVVVGTDTDDVNEPRRYEVSYLLIPIIAIEQITGTVETLIRGTITTAGGQIIGGEEPKLISLTYSIRKTIDNKNLRFKEAYFASLRFTISPDQIELLARAFRFSPPILRFLVIELPKHTEDSRRQPKEKVVLLAKNNVIKDEQSLVAEMTQADIDREIDELLVSTAQSK